MHTRDPLAEWQENQASTEAYTKDDVQSSLLLIKWGTENPQAQEESLLRLGHMAHPSLIPFWHDMIETQNAPEGMREIHQTIALAALAYIAVRTRETAAFNALHQSTRHASPEVRALAIHYLSRAYCETDQPYPASFLADVAATAVAPATFEERFQARNVLRLAGKPIPLDNAGGVFDLQVSPFKFRRIHRTIAIRSEQTLRDLQRFIQHAFDWDNERLFSFYMNGRKYSKRYRFSCAHEQDRPPWAYEAVIGELGLVPNQRFLYHYDYANDNLFEISVVGIRPHVREGNYPRLIDSHGKSPAQPT